MADGVAGALALGVGAMPPCPPALGDPLTLGLVVACGDALPDGAGLAVPDGAALGVGAGAAAAPLPSVALRTLRKRSSAALPTSVRSRFWPGREMTMLRLPSVTTSASATPYALTRLSMIWRASSRLPAVGGLPSTVFVASSVSRVPPTRSRPSRGSSRSFQPPLAPPEKNTKR